MPRIKEIEGKSNVEKHETISMIRSQHSINEICEAWGICLGTYYNLMRRWGIDLSEVHRRKRKLQKGSQNPHNNPGRENFAPARLAILLLKELDGDSFSGHHT